MKFSKKDKKSHDPLLSSSFREPGFMERLQETLLGRNRPLANVQLEITSVCTSKCNYCPHTTMAGNWHSRHMSAEVMASLWPLLRNAEHAHLQGWGEPLLHPRFFDFVRFAAKAGCQTSTTSCGTNLTDEAIKRLVNDGPDIIAFSFTGTDALSNSARQGTDFDEICANIKKLREKIKNAGHGPEIHLAYLLLRNQLDAVKKLPELMDTLDVNFAVISTLDYLALPEQKSLAFGLNNLEEIAEAKQILETIVKSVKDKQIIYALPDRNAVCEKGCRENIANSLYVDADGQISPCVYLNVPAKQPDKNSVVFGNSLEEDVWEIWQKPEFKNFRESLVADDPPLHCQGCPKRKESISTLPVENEENN